MIACSMQQDVDKGVKLGQLARQVLPQLDVKTDLTKVLMVEGTFLVLRKYHIKETLSLFQQGYTAGLEVGDPIVAGYNINNSCFHAFWCGQPLSSLEPEIHTCCDALTQLNQETTTHIVRAYWQSTLNLLGLAEQPMLLSGEVFPEAELVPVMIADRNFTSLSHVYLLKLMFAYLFGDIAAAQNQSGEARHYVLMMVGLILVPVFYFYDSLTALAQCNSPSAETSELLQRVEENQTQLQQQWAHHAPMNYQHKYDLVEAEKARVLGQKAEAIELYDKAIAGAKENEYIQEEALANELAAKFYLNWGKEKIAASYMTEAYYCYARWGAKAKTDQVLQHYLQLLQPILSTPQISLKTQETITIATTTNPTVTDTSTSSSSTTALDAASPIKACQVISSELEHEQLIGKLAGVLMENAGATQCALILPNDKDWRVEAIATLTDDKTIKTFPHHPLKTSPDVPISLIRYVRNTKTLLSFNDISQEKRWSRDSYLQKSSAKSVLCLPILKQETLYGILYLENNQLVAAFPESKKS